MQDPPQIQEYLSRGYREKYGMLWAPNPDGTPLADIQIEFAAFSANLETKAEHFWNIVSFFWGPGRSPKLFDRNPWGERMVHHLCGHKFLAIAGCASSTKTETAAIWGIVNFLASPTKTKVLLTSTSLKDSRQRIWGTVEEYWQAACIVVGGEENMPGELVSASGMIRRKTGELRSDKQGLTLIAGDKSKAKESIGKLIGFKAGRVILIADELPELSESLINAAESNLFSNPEFQMVGIGNPNSYFDPFGVFCEPRAGWNSVTEHSEEWRTVKGFCIKFDGEKSPNILAGRTIYPYMMTQERLEEYRRKLGTNSPRYWRMVRGFFCPTGSSEGVVADRDILAYEADKPAVWREPPVMVAGLDPAFTHEGDRCVLVTAKFGTTTAGLKTLEFQKIIELDEDADDKTASRSEQIVNKLVAACVENHILPENLAIDDTGGGKSFCDVVRMLWSNKFLPVSFGGAPSTNAFSSLDPRPANEVCVNKVSEIWFAGSDYIRSNQIKGVSKDLAAELCARLYTTKERGKVQVEPKKDMKKRTGESPDKADAALLALALCRLRLGMAPKALPANAKNRRLDFGSKPYKMLARRYTKLRRY